MKIELNENEFLIRLVGENISIRNPHDTKSQHYETIFKKLKDMSRLPTQENVSWVIDDKGNKISGEDYVNEKKWEQIEKEWDENPPQLMNLFSWIKQRCNPK